MERLTEWSSSGHAAVVNHRENYIDRLAAYEDLEEQGRLVVLPCKVGDTVYFVGGLFGIDDPRKAVHFGVVTSIKAVVFKNGEIKHLADIEYEHIDPWYRDGRTMKAPAMCSFEPYGSWRRFYLTREEAEKALKGDGMDA